MGNRMEELEYSQELLDMLQRGKKVRVLCSRKSTYSEIREIHSVIDGQHVVYRVWDFIGNGIFHVGCWAYRIEHISDFALHFKDGRLNVI